MDSNLIISLLFFVIILGVFLFIFKKINNSNNEEVIRASFKEISDNFLENKDESAKILELRFKDIANKILDEKNKIIEERNESFAKKNLNDINLTLNPFKEKFEELNKQIIDNKEQQVKLGENFKHHVESILTVTENMQEDANNLTKALKGDSKTQGLWGEQILARTLEQSGLVKDLNYKLQEGHKDNSGKTQIPDAIIYLPGDRNIVIDSKVSLRSYESFMNEKDDKEKEKFLKKHVNDMKDRVRELRQKDYSALFGINSPDYVLIFIPIESAYSAAVTYDWEFQKLSSESKIAFTTPTTLMAILRMSENLWRLDKQNKNAHLIAERAGLLIDKFDGFVSDIEDIGKNIEKANTSFLGARNKLYKGKGNLFTQLADLEDLGAKNKKRLKKPNDNLLENIEDIDD